MKRTTLSFWLPTTAIAFFVLGRWSIQPTSLPAERVDADLLTAGRRLDEKRRPQGKPKLSEAEATGADSKTARLASYKAMSTAQRMNYIAQGALIFDGPEQADYLCDILGVLNKEELQQASEMLGNAQNRGNIPSQIVWDTLWTQFGRVDPKGCLEEFNRSEDSRTRSDARFVMRGWLEADPAAALAWAREPKITLHEGEAAALILRQESGGDPRKLAAALEKLPPQSATVKDALNDYFDLAGVNTVHTSAAEAYAALPSALQKEAWPVAMSRLIYTDAQAAVNWLTAHASDPGAHYPSSAHLIVEMARENPSGTAAWTSQLPVHGDGKDSFHPAMLALKYWKKQDPIAAEAWRAAQPADAPWVTQDISAFSGSSSHSGGGIPMTK